MSRISGIIRQSLESSAPWASEEERFERNMALALEGLDLQRQHEEISDVLSKLDEMSTGLESINTIIDAAVEPDASLVVMCRMQLQGVHSTFGLESHVPSVESVSDPAVELMMISNESRSLGGKIWDALVWIYNKFRAFLKWLNPWSKETVKKTQEDLKDLKEDVKELEKEVKESPETVEVTPAAVARVAKAKEEVQVLEKASKKLVDVKKKVTAIEKVAGDAELTQMCQAFIDAIARREDDPEKIKELGQEYRKVAEEKIKVLTEDTVTIDSLRDDLREIAKSAEAEGANPGTPIREVVGNNELKVFIKDLKEIVSKESTLTSMQKQAADMLVSVDRIRVQIDGKMKDIESFVNTGPQDPFSTHAINMQISFHRKLVNETNQLAGILQGIIDGAGKTVGKAASGTPKGKGSRRGRRGR